METFQRHLERLAQATVFGNNAMESALVDMAGVLPKIMNTILADATLFENVVRRSYAHRNGFIKLVLYEAPWGRLRSHIWPAGGFEEELPHNHRWGFSSVVLRDALQHVFYEPKGDGETYRHYTYSAQNTTGQGIAATSHFSEGVPVTLAPCERLDVAAGQSYSLDHRRIHRANPTGRDGTITLLVEKMPHASPTADVYDDRGTLDYHGTDYHDGSLAPDRVRQLLLQSA